MAVTAVAQLVNRPTASPICSWADTWHVVFRGAPKEHVDVELIAPGELQAAAARRGNSTIATTTVLLG